MRKLMLILLALCLAVMPCLAEGASLTEYNFGDFTLTFPSDTIGEIADTFEPNQVFFTLYQDYSESDSFHKNVNGVWNAEYEDVTQIDPEGLGNTILEQAVDQFISYGISVENPTLLRASLDELGGKPSIFLMYSTDLDYTNAGVDLQVTMYTIQAIVSEPTFGTYSFTISTDDVEASMPLAEILDSIVWNN